jgi:hypothetical protein
MKEQASRLCYEPGAAGRSLSVVNGATFVIRTAA